MANQLTRYIYVGGPWREFRGHIFCNGLPTEIKDKGTLSAISRMKDFVLVEDLKKDSPEEKKEPPKMMERVSRTLRLPGRGRA